METKEHEWFMQTDLSHYYRILGIAEDDEKRWERVIATNIVSKATAGLLVNAQRMREQLERFKDDPEVAELLKKIDRDQTEYFTEDIR